MILFIKLLLAHLIGDFVLQPPAWIVDKQLKKIRSDKLYLHGLVHFLLIVLIVWDYRIILPALVISVLHIAIDAAKIYYQNRQSAVLWFFLDQGLHIAVLLLMVWVVYPESLLIPWPLKNQLITMATAFLFLLTPSSIIVKTVLSRWAPSTEIKTDKIETPSLVRAGAMIGYLERTLVFIFILAGQWAAIGFLVTAKSVFRFSDLKIGQDRKLTEYILIGTLLSFGLAIITGVVCRWVIPVIEATGVAGLP